MDEHYLPKPELSYGAHKLMIETAIQDLSRRGEVDGRVVRLPGIVARPSQANGFRSAFMSDLMHAVAAGKAYVCPVAAEATAWWMSLDYCVQNLLHAAQLKPQAAGRVWQLPVLHLSIEQLLQALFDTYGGDRRALIRFEPDQSLEKLFGRFPPLHTPEAISNGFRDDGSASELVRRALS